MFSLFLFSVVPSLLYFCFADAYLHLAVFLNTLSLTYQKKKKQNYLLLLSSKGSFMFSFHFIVKKENQQHTTNSKTLKQSYKTTNSKNVLSVVFRITRIKKKKHD